MVDSDKTVDYAIAADPAAFVAAMHKAHASAKEASAQITGAWDAVGAKFKAVQGIVTTMLAVVAGGAAFKAVIDQTVAWGTETGKISRQLQVSTEKATAYQVAMQHLGIDSATLIDASDKMARQLTKNETAFKAIGVETRNANLSWRSTGEMLPEVMDKLRGMKNTTEQNVAGMQLFGRSWAELRPLLKLGSDELDLAGKRAKALNLAVDPKEVRAYKEGINDLKLVSTALEHQVGKELLPVMISLGQWFGEAGPPLLTSFTVALKSVVSVVVVAWGAVKIFINGLVGAAGAFLALTQGKFALAGDILKTFGDNMVSDAKEAWKGVVDVWTQTLPKAGPDGPADGKHTDFAKAKAAKENILALWEAQLEERKLKLQEAAAAEGRFAEMGKDEERAYWQAKLGLTQAGSTEQISIRKKLAALGIEILKDQFATELAGLHAQQEAYKANLGARRELIEQEAALVAQKYGQQSKEYQAVQAKLTALAREGAAQRLQIEEISQTRLRAIAQAQVDADAQDLQLMLALQQIDNAQFLQGEQQLEERRYQIADQALQARLQLLTADADRDPVKVAQVNADIEQLALQHQQRLQQIRNAAAVNSASYTLGMMDSLRNGFEGVFNQLGRGITSLSGLLKGMLNVVVGAVQSMLAKMAADWLMATIRNKVFAISQAMGQIQAQAAVAGAGGVASMAAAPFPLNLGAPAFGASMAAASMAFAAGLAIPSAAGGWDIPRDTLAMVHEKEVILPASIAQPLKAQLAEGSFGGGGGGGGTVVINTTGGNFIHKDDLARLLKKLGRNFEFVS